jgi:hypothetical protein
MLYSSVGIADWEYAEKDCSNRECWVLLRTVPVVNDERSEILSFTHLNALANNNYDTGVATPSIKMLRIT